MSSKWRFLAQLLSSAFSGLVQQKRTLGIGSTRVKAPRAAAGRQKAGGVYADPDVPAPHVERVLHAAFLRALIGVGRFRPYGNVALHGHVQERAAYDWKHHIERPLMRPASQQFRRRHSDNAPPVWLAHPARSSTKRRLPTARSYHQGEHFALEERHADVLMTGSETRPYVCAPIDDDLTASRLGYHGRSAPTSVVGTHASGARGRIANGFKSGVPCPLKARRMAVQTTRARAITALHTSSDIQIDVGPHRYYRPEMRQHRS